MTDSERETLVKERKGHKPFFGNYTFGRETALYKQGNVNIELETDSKTDTAVSPCKLFYYLRESGDLIRKNQGFDTL